MSGTTTFEAEAYLDGVLGRRLDERARGWVAERAAEVAAGVDGVRFAALLSMASRFVPTERLEPDEAECEQARTGLRGWNPERWDLRESARARLVLARADQESEAFARDLEDVFRYSDEGEARALYKSLCLLPAGERFAWRAKEGCRTNIVPVFESVACDNPYPFTHFDDVAWNQLCLKAVFIGAPLWRVYGLDERLSEELARMALDLVDERRSAGRPVQPELWLCLGRHGGERALASAEREFAGSDRLGWQAAALALARAGESGRLRELAQDAGDAELAAAAQGALDARPDQGAFRIFHDRSSTRGPDLPRDGRIFHEKESDER